MAKVICIAGESGSGKTTSMRNLDPKTTYYIDCDKKGLSWKGWKTQYNSANKNYYSGDFQQIVLKLLHWVNGEEYDNRTQGYAKNPKCEGLKVKTVVVDTLNGIMVADEIRRMGEKNYDKWADLAASVYSIVDFALTMRDDVAVIFVAHTQTERDDSGYAFTRIKTSGKKLDKICLESKFTTVLIAKCIDGKYVFETQSNMSTAKSPMGAFDTPTIENDITLVLKALEDY